MRSLVAMAAYTLISGPFAVENPAKKWPGVFEKVPLFVKYPYLLPCCVAASVTFTGQSTSTLTRLC